MRKTLGALGLLFLLSTPVLAQTRDGADTGDTAWLLVSTALVMLMTAPGLALFYGGLVSQRNVLSTMMHSFFILCLISIQWVLFGYTLSFGHDLHSVVGGLEFLGFRGVGQAPLPNSTVPHIAFAMFQGMFAIITVALITGSFAERIRFGAFILFALLWSTLVYDPLAHWVWGGGWLQKLGALDFAGGTVVHISSGVSALVAAVMIGRRIGYPGKVAPPHNMPLTLLGAGLLWFGWFGFNGGSALTSSGLAAVAFGVTNTAAAAGALAWTLVEGLTRKRPTALGTATGAVAGLVAITPAAGYVHAISAIAIGGVAGILCYWGVNVLKARRGYDDSLDVFGVHGLAGTWGAIATGIFASTSVNPAGANGLLFGNPKQVLIQLAGVVAAWVVAAVGTWVILKAVNWITPFRAASEAELAGLDASIHRETAYHFQTTDAGRQ